jgi:hypothetical protein
VQPNTLVDKHLNTLVDKLLNTLQVNLDMWAEDQEPKVPKVPTLTEVKLEDTPLEDKVPPTPLESHLELTSVEDKPTPPLPPLASPLETLFTQVVQSKPTTNTWTPQSHLGTLIRAKDGSNKTLPTPLATMNTPATTREATQLKNDCWQLHSFHSLISADTLQNTYRWSYD